MERVGGIEPPAEAGKAAILAVIRHPHMVLVAGLEPARYRYHGIFLLLYVTIAALLRCSLDYVFTISFLT